MVPNVVNVNISEFAVPAEYKDDICREYVVPGIKFVIVYGFERVKRFVNNLPFVGVNVIL